MRSKSEKLITTIAIIRDSQRRMRWWTAAISVTLLGILAYALPRIFVGRPPFGESVCAYGIGAVLLAYFAWTVITTVIESYRIEKVLLPWLERWLYQELRR
jgi:hypothetical protein